MATAVQIREYHVRKNPSGKFIVEVLRGLMDTYFLRNPSAAHSQMFDTFKEARAAARRDAEQQGVKAFITNYR